MIISARMKKFCATQLKVLADETRLHVLRELMAGARNVGELNKVLAIDQSLLSHHLRVLRMSGLVIAQRAGKAVRYRLAPQVSLGAGQVINLGCCKLSFPSAGTAAAASNPAILRNPGTGS